MRIFTSIKRLPDLGTLTSFCDKNLARVGSGCSRKVYRLTMQKVVKVASAQHNIIENIREYVTYERLKDHLPLARIFEYDPEGKWLVMEWAKALSWAYEDHPDLSVLKARARAYDICDVLPFNCGYAKGRLKIIDYAD